MRILILTEVYHPETVGGSGRYARDLARSLAQLGHEPWVLTRNPGLRSAASEESDGVHIVRYPVPAEVVPWLPAVELKSARRAAADLARRVRFDVIHAQQPMVATAALGVAELARLPWVYTFQSAWHEEYLIKTGRQQPGEAPRFSVAASAMRRIEARVLRKVGRAIVLSSYSENRLEALHGFRRPIVRIPGGVDLDTFRLDPSRGEARQRLGLPVDAELVFCARNLVPRMGLENLIDATAALRGRRANIRLVIGGSGPLAQALEHRAANSGCPDAIQLAGRIPEAELPFYYRAADLFVLPTVQLEGFGLVTVESLASGTPVIATPVGGSVDILQPFHPRSLTAGIDSRSLANKIEDYFEQPNAWPSAFACRAYASGNFGWDCVAQATERVYEATILDALRTQPRPPLSRFRRGAHGVSKPKPTHVA